MSYSQYLKQNLRQYAMLVALLAIMIFFGVATDGILFRPVNLTNVISQKQLHRDHGTRHAADHRGRTIDLSVGFLSGFIRRDAATMMVPWGIHPVIAFLACLLLGGLIGAVQGYFDAYQKIPLLHRHFGRMLVFRGLMIALLGSVSIRIPEGVSGHFLRLLCRISWARAGSVLLCPAGLSARCQMLQHRRMPLRP